MHATAVQGIRQPTGEPIQPSLGGPINIIGAPHPEARDGREHHNRSAPLPPQQIRHMRQNTHMRDIIGVDNLNRVRGIPLGPPLIPQNPKRRDNGVNRPEPGEHILENLLVTADVVSVELDPLDLLGARVQQRLGFIVQCRRTPCRQHNRTLGQPRPHSQADLTTPTQNQNRHAGSLGSPHRVRDMGLFDFTG